jgi:membrane-associated phospholipid phosphatase
VTSISPPSTNLLEPERRRGGRIGEAAAALRRWPVGLPTLAWLAGWAALLLGVLVLAGTMLAGERGALRQFDTRAVEDLAAGRTPTWDSVTDLLTLPAETLTVTVLAVAAFVGFRVGLHRWREAALVASAVAGEVTIFLLTTLLVDRKRPPVPQLDEAPPTSSFPSGHTAAAIVMYGALAVVASGRVRSRAARAAVVAVAVLIPASVAVSRIYRGMHFPTDVIGGVLLGMAWLVIAVLGVRLGVVHARAKGRAGGSR